MRRHISIHLILRISLLFLFGITGYSQETTYFTLVSYGIPYDKSELTDYRLSKLKIISRHDLDILDVYFSGKGNNATDNYYSLFPFGREDLSLINKYNHFRVETRLHWLSLVEKKWDPMAEISLCYDLPYVGVELGYVMSLKGIDKDEGLNGIFLNFNLGFNSVNGLRYQAKTKKIEIAERSKNVNLMPIEERLQKTSTNLEDARKRVTGINKELFGLDEKYDKKIVENEKRYEAKLQLKSEEIVKDEFETTAQYNNRVMLHEQSVDQNIKYSEMERDSTKNELRNLKILERRVLTLERNRILSQEFKIDDLQVELGDYDAETELYSAQLVDFPYHIAKILVRRQEAEGFHNDGDQLKYSGYAKVNEAGDAIFYKITAKRGDVLYDGSVVLDNYYLWKKMASYKYKKGKYITGTQDGKYLAVGFDNDDKNSTNIIDLSNGKVKYNLPAGPRYSTPSISNDGKWIAMETANRNKSWQNSLPYEVHIYDLESGILKLLINNSSNMATRVDFSVDDKYLKVAGNQNVFMYSVPNFHRIKLNEESSFKSNSSRNRDYNYLGQKGELDFIGKWKDHVKNADISKDEKFLLHEGKLVDFEKGLILKKFPTNGKVRYVSFVDNDNRILIVDDMINIYERSEYVPNKPTLVSSERALLAPKLDLIAAFVDPNGNGYLEAEEQARFNVSIKNSGEGDALGVMLEASLNLDDPNIDYLKRVYVGNISKGEEKKVPIQISASSKVRVNQLAMAFSAKESNGFSPDPIEILFESKPLILPDLRLVDYGLTTAIDDNIIRPGVRTDIQVRIQNQGQGFADDIYFKIILPSNLFFDPGSQTEYQDIQLGPGKYKDLEFSFTCNNNVGAKVELKIDYKEAHTQGSLPLSLDVDKAQQSIKQFTVKRSKIASVEINDVSTISVDIEDDIPKAKTINKKAIGVVFGIEQYKDISDVTFATRDAKWIYKYFQDVLGIPKSRIYFRTNSDVSKAEFDKVLLSDGWLDKRVEAGETEVYFYYAGHGAPDIKQNKAYLIPYDGDPNYASQTGIKLDDIYSRLNALDAKSVTVFWDACFSGANRNNEMLLADARPVFIEVEEDVAGGITVFSAASARQISSAWPEKKHGLFSYFLMKGLQGEADTNKDKQITIGELGKYLDANISEMAGMLDREQTPELQSMNPEQVLIQF